ncbi:MAG: hypothetical protein RBU45_16790 [Myxococcota bacterium]|nr:hypothetical protein [Myxococcota bacterium]
MIKNLTATLFGILLLTLQSSVAFPDLLGMGGPDLFVCLVAYLGLRRDLVAGAIPLVIVGFLADTYAATPAGLHLGTAVIVFLLLQLLQMRLVIRGLGAGVVIVVLSSLAAAIVFWLLATIFVPSFSGGVALLRFAFPKALLTAPFAIVVLWVMSWLDGIDPWSRRPSRNGLQFDLLPR